MRSTLLRATLVVFACAFLAAPASAARPLKTAITDPGMFADPGTRARSFDRVRSTGATVVRLVLNWNQVAAGAEPANPTSPNDPAYSWGEFDAQVAAAKARGLEPFVGIVFAPRWAEGAGSGPAGTVAPDPVRFGQFAKAAATRYSGSFAPPGQGPLPRVRYWQAWNEPNRDYFLMPQYQGDRIASAPHYRAMVRRFAAGVHAVSSANRVIAGGLAPLGRPGKPAPLAFMRSLLCVSATLQRTCDLRSNPIAFDVWSHHPYTSGGPTHSAAARDDVSLGDLPEMRRLLNAAVRLGHVRPLGPVGFWVTEFSWDSDPPDPKALPASLHARWVSEALYRMWKHGVSVVTWWRIQDDPLTGPNGTPYQSGFYTVSGKAKRSLTAFRFPVVALRRSGRIFVWGRTPAGRRGTVVVELKTGRTWRRLGTLATTSYGIFTRSYTSSATRGYVRARLAGTRTASLPFSLTYAKDRYVNPFGCGGGIPC